jgi:hypothetical protein
MKQRMSAKELDRLNRDILRENAEWERQRRAPAEYRTEVQPRPCQSSLCDNPATMYLADGYRCEVRYLCDECYEHVAKRVTCPFCGVDDHEEYALPVA